MAVGWHRLVRPLIDEGRLVPFTDLRIAAPGSYYLSWNANHEPSDAIADAPRLADGGGGGRDRLSRRQASSGVEFFSSGRRFFLGSDSPATLV